MASDSHTFVRRLGERRHLRVRPSPEPMRPSRHPPQLGHRTHEVERRRIEADHGRQDGIGHRLEGRIRKPGEKFFLRKAFKCPFKFSLAK